MNSDNTTQQSNQEASALPPRNAGSQRELVLEILRKRGTQGLSSLEALRYSIMRLPNRVCELRAQGFQIDGRPERTGCMRYFLLREPAYRKPLPSYDQRTRELQRDALPLFAEIRP